MTVSQCMKSMTYREYLGWLAFLEEPDRTDWYLMQIAYEVAGVLQGKKYRDNVSVKDFKLGFTTKNTTKKIEQSAVAAANCWFAIAGVDFRVTEEQVEEHQAKNKEA